MWNSPPPILVCVRVFVLNPHPQVGDVIRFMFSRWDVTGVWNPQRNHRQHHLWRSVVNAVRSVLGGRNGFMTWPRLSPEPLVYCNVFFLLYKHRLRVKMVISVHCDYLFQFKFCVWDEPHNIFTKLNCFVVLFVGCRMLCRQQQRSWFSNSFCV